MGHLHHKAETRVLEHSVLHEATYVDHSRYVKVPYWRELLFDSKSWFKRALPNYYGPDLCFHAKAGIYTENCDPFSFNLFQRGLEVTCVHRVVEGPQDLSGKTAPG